jgi:hypothetical protein
MEDITDFLVPELVMHQYRMGEQIIFYLKTTKFNTYLHYIPSVNKYSLKIGYKSYETHGEIYAKLREIIPNHDCDSGK